MRITHEWKEKDYEKSGEDGAVYKTVKKTWNNVFDVTFYDNITWKRVYWCTTTTGVRAYCFRDYYNDNDDQPQSIWFENEHEMRRFQENLRLQEQDARAPTTTQAIAVR